MPLTDEPLKVTSVVLSPLHISGQVGAVTEGVGLTVIVNVCPAPVQSSAVGITFIVATMGDEL